MSGEIGGSRRGGGRRVHRRARHQAGRRLHRRLHGAARQDDGPRRRDRLRLAAARRRRRPRRSRRAACASADADRGGRARRLAARSPKLAGMSTDLLRPRARRRSTSSTSRACARPPQPRLPDDPGGTVAYGTSVGYGPLREWIAEQHGVARGAGAGHQRLDAGRRVPVRAAGRGGRPGGRRVADLRPHAAEPAQPRRGHPHGRAGDGRHRRRRAARRCSARGCGRRSRT